MNSGHVKCRLRNCLVQTKRAVLARALLISGLLLLIPLPTATGTDFSHSAPLIVYKFYGMPVVVENTEQLVKTLRWLDRIFSTPTGYETLRAIQSCGSRVTVRHSRLATPGAGITRAVASSNLWNGIGVHAEILINLEMSDQGEHRVRGMYQDVIEFTADQNLMHELSHARHKSCGTEYARDPEYQAIRDENNYRRDLAQAQGSSARLRGKVGIVKLEEPVVAPSVPAESAATQRL